MPTQRWGALIFSTKVMKSALNRILVFLRGVVEIYGSLYIICVKGARCVLSKLKMEMPISKANG